MNAQALLSRPARPPPPQAPLPSELPYRFQPDHGEVDVAGRLLADPVARVAIDEDWGWDHFRWEEHGHYVPAALLAPLLSDEELARVYLALTIHSSVEAHVEAHHPVLAKVQSSHWRYAMQRDWPTFARHVTALSALHSGDPRVGLRLTWAPHFGDRGYAVHVRNPALYLDAPFGLLVEVDGHPALTVGFALAPSGVFLAQVQGRRAHGNRGLFALGLPPLEWALGVLARAFPDDPLWLVTGEGAVAGVRASYRAGAETGLTPEGEVRLVAAYDRPLAGWRRDPELGEWIYGVRRFVRLVEAS